MSRWYFTPLPRTIRSDRRVAKLSDASGMFWLMLLSQVDPHGRIGADTEILNADVWPLRRASLATVDAAVGDLVQVGLLELHEAEGRRWFQVADWDASYGAFGRQKDKPDSEFQDSTLETLVGTPSSTASPKQHSAAVETGATATAPASTNIHRTAPTGTDRHDAAPTPTVKHGTAPSGTGVPHARARVKLRVTDSERERERADGNALNTVEAGSPATAPSVKSGRKQPAGAHAEVIEYHAERFAAIYGEPYAFADARDGTAVKAMLKNACGDAAAVKAKIDRAFADPWLREKSCTLTLIRSQWSKLVAPKSSSAPARPHDPNQPDWGGSDRQGREREVVQAWQTLACGDPSVRPDLWQRAERVLLRFGMHFPDVVPADAPTPRPWESGYTSRATGVAS